MNEVRIFKNNEWNVGMDKVTADLFIFRLNDKEDLLWFEYYLPVTGQGFKRIDLSYVSFQNFEDLGAL